MLNNHSVDLLNTPLDSREHNKYGRSTHKCFSFFLFFFGEY